MEEELQVLVIDDDDEMRAMMIKVLHSEGHQVFAVASAEEGLELLPYHTFQVALLDQNLPGMEGLVLGEYLIKNNPHLKIALVTGSDEPKLDKLTEAHGIALVRKPFKPSDILDLMRQYREEEEERREQRLAHDAPDYDPPIARHFRDLATTFSIPHSSQRVEERLVEVVKASLTQLRSNTRYNERDRVVALGGLLTMSVLGIRAPKLKSGRDLFEEYDQLMTDHGRRRAFSENEVSEDDES